MGKIRDVNAAMLVAFAHSIGAVADFIGIIPDSLEAVRAASKIHFSVMTSCCSRAGLGGREGRRPTGSG